MNRVHRLGVSSNSKKILREQTKNRERQQIYYEEGRKRKVRIELNLLTLVCCIVVAAIIGPWFIKIVVQTFNSLVSSANFWVPLVVCLILMMISVCILVTVLFCCYYWAGWANYPHPNLLVLLVVIATLAIIITLWGNFGYLIFVNLPKG